MGEDRGKTSFARDIGFLLRLKHCLKFTPTDAVCLVFNGQTEQYSVKWMHCILMQLEVDTHVSVSVFSMRDILVSELLFANI